MNATQSRLVAAAFAAMSFLPLAASQAQVAQREAIQESAPIKVRQSFTESRFIQPVYRTNRAQVQSVYYPARWGRSGYYYGAPYARSFYTGPRYYGGPQYFYGDRAYYRGYNSPYGGAPYYGAPGYGYYDGPYGRGTRVGGLRVYWR